MKKFKFLAVPVAIAILALGSFGTASAQTASPRLALQFATSGLTSPLVASSTDATVARLILDTTGSTEPVRVSSIPFNLIVGNGALADTLRNCRVFSESNPSVALNSSSSTTAAVSGINNIMLNAPLILSANTITTLALRCDIAGNLVSGGNYTINTNTTNWAAVGAITGFPASVTVRGSVVVPPVVVDPGLPVTGPASDTLTNFLTLLGSTLLATFGLAYILKQSKKA